MLLLEPIHCVVNFPFYKRVPQKTFLATIGYLSFLGLIFSISMVVAFYVIVRPHINEATEWLSMSVPTLTLTDGKLSSAVPGPLEIRHPKIEQFAIVIDTDRTSRVRPEEMEQKKLLAYLTRDAIYVWNTRQVEVLELAKTKNPEPLVMDPKFYRSIRDLILKIIYPIAFFTSWLMFMVWKHAAALIYSLLALLINAIMGGPLEYPELYKLAVYTQTPVIVLQIVSLFLPDIPLFGLIALLVVGVYLWQAIRQLRPPSTPEPSPA
ncbi:DUF1189 family protein [Elusimicrobiota bacterium]